MRRIFTLCFIPFLIAIFTVALLSLIPEVKNFLNRGYVVPTQHGEDLRYIYNFHSNKYLEDEFLKQPDDSATIYLLGSSELTTGTKYLSYHFISDRFPVKVMGVGHEGNQCFSIYCQLLAKSHLLDGAPVVIILSPGWFEAKPSRGTTSAVFLEYNSEAFMRGLHHYNVEDRFKHYAYAGISHFYDELNAPDAAFRKANIAYRSSLSFYHRIWCSPVFTWNTIIDYIKDSPTLYAPHLYSGRGSFEREVEPVACAINWDSLLTITKDSTLAGATNNSLGIENEYYSTYINGKKGKIQPVAEQYNTELRDFRMLVELLKSKKAKASFVISPLNPYYFTTLPKLQPTVDTLAAVLQRNDFPVLNLFTSDTTNYDKALLGDVMHLSDYGWLQVNRFIINTYGLCK
ncbi:MAG: hypothetical protein JNM19_15805 [Chitinophagaceae bacterium]|nr:hypothetical protein [Chitinophagaceae bacterium]